MLRGLHTSAPTPTHTRQLAFRAVQSEDVRTFMPAALPVDREKVKMVALQVGVREAARQFELNEDTVMAWSRREAWFAQKEQTQQVVEKHIADRGMQAVARKTPSEVMLQYKGKTKLAQAKTVYKTAHHFSRLAPEVLAKKTQDVKNNVDSASKLWPEVGPDQRTLVNVNILAQRLPDAPE